MNLRKTFGRRSARRGTARRGNRERAFAPASAKRVRRARWLIFVLLFVCHVSVAAQQGDSCKLDGVQVGFTASMCSHHNYTVAFNDKVVTGTGDCTAENWVTSPLTYTELKADQPYQLTVGTDSCSTHVDFVVPDEYYLEIDGVEAKAIDKVGGSTKGSGDGSWTVVLRKRCPCGGDGPGESSGPRRGSILWEVGMGRLSDGRTAHSISLREAVLSSYVYTPAALVYSPPGRTSEVDVVRNANGLRQVKAPQALADIVVISANEYNINFYAPGNVGAKSGGLYAVTGQPFVSWKVKNPDPSSTSKLQISKSQSGATDTGEYTWDSISDSWTLTTGNGARIESSTITYPTQTSRVETTVVKDNGGSIVSKTANTFHTFLWGENLIQEVSDPDGAALKTVYAYYENPADAGRYSRLKSVTNPDGSWEKYDYDGAGNRVLVMRPWKDLALDAATESNSHATRYTYSNYDGVSLSLYAKHVSSVIETVAGAVVRKATYTRTGTTVNGNPAVVERATVYSSAADGLVTTTTRYHYSAVSSLAGRQISVEYPDGRKDTYSYEKGDYTPNADPSLSQFTPNVSGFAERETVVHGTLGSPDGVALKTTRETNVRDRYGRQVLQETYVYDGAVYERAAWTVMDYDDRGHLTQTRRHDGQVTSSTWSGDRKISEVDAFGIETTYTYDSLGRVEKRTNKGVAVSGTFPAQADIVTAYTYDVEGRRTGVIVTGGSLSLGSSSAYDRAGRIKSETDQAELVTVHAYSNGGRTQTVTRPGGATEITDKYLDGQTKSVTGTAVVTRHFDYGVNLDGTQYGQEFVGSGGLDSPRWTKTTTDWLGRTIKVERPGFNGTALVQISTYNGMGQLQSEATLAGASKLLADRLYEYDELGNQVRAGSDLDASGTLLAASTDRMVETETVYEKSGSVWFQVTTTRSYLTDNSASSTTQTQMVRLTNFQANGTEQTVSETVVTDTAGNNTTSITVIDRGSKKVIQKTDTPDSSVDAVSISVNGLVQSSAPDTPEAATTYTYDALGRQTGVTDPRTGTTTRAYNPATGQLSGVSDAVSTTSYEYYPATHTSAGRLKAQVNAAGKKVYFNYNSRGETVRTWGEATYPAEYVYDGYGQRAELRTFRGGQNWGAGAWPASTTGAADVTRWIYHEATGLLESKQDAATRQVSYGYDVLGRLTARAWARGVSCTYSYDPTTGELTGVNYADATPDVTFGYDRGGRQTSIVDAAGAHTRSFNARGELQTDQISGGLLDLVQVHVSYDQYLRRQFLQASRGATVLTSQTYGYDSSSRLETVTSGGQTVSYAYYPNTGLLNTTSFTGGTQISRSYDTLGRLQTITTGPPADTPQSYIYTYNNLHQRTKVTREDGSYWSYGYNDRGELVFGRKYWADNTPVWGNQTEYSFDNIGNRNFAKNGGNEMGNLRQSNYTTNSLNQYVQRGVPGAVDVAGTANSAATVTVNNQAAARRGEYFYNELAVNNSAGAVYAQVNVVGARQNYGAGGEDAVTEWGGRVYVPQAAESYSYDADGNLTSDGRWNYMWDGENRLISMEAIASVPMEAKQRLEFAYDYMERRVQKKVYAWVVATSSYQLQSITKFVYDGWNLMAELDGNNALIRSYVWGQDLSGSLQGAGGIGGLLLINDGVIKYQAGYDDNGNVAALVKASNGVIAASYEYDPFGNNLKSVGEYAAQNPYRFSNKYMDNESGLLYYGYRYYNPKTGGWVSRDPMYEVGFNSNYVELNSGSAFFAEDQSNNDPAEIDGREDLYTFTGNNPVNVIDAEGLYGRIIPESFKRDVVVSKIREVRVRIVNRVVTKTYGPWQENGVIKDVTQATVVYSEGPVAPLGRWTQPKLGKFPRDERGHIIGRQLGGPGIPDNLFSQRADINGGDYETHEGQIRKYLDTHTCLKLELKISLLYNKPPDVPIGAVMTGVKRWTKRLAYRAIGVKYRAKFSDGTEFNEDFSN